MKCIYCNSEENMSESDIIPYSLTGAKVKKRFVCRTHNLFTNDNYEKIVLSLDTGLDTSYEGIKSLNLIDWLIERKQ